MKKYLYSFFLLLASCFCSSESFALTPQKEVKTTFVAASFNVRMDTPKDSINAWPNRKELVKALIRFHDFDIFGVQEAFRHQLNGILELTDYACIGEGRDGNDEGEHSAIIYKKDRFTLLDKGDFWFSEIPDQIGLGWDATCCNRICSWGKFKENKTGKVFFFFNSHFDHQGQVARRESSKLLLKKMKEIAKNAPAFSSGDYNATPDSEPIQILTSDGLLQDSYVISEQPPYGTVGTFQGFKRLAISQARIDYIFVTRNVRILKYATLNEVPNGKFPSDHFPIMAVVEL